jgi:hypothetical protein
MKNKTTNSAIKYYLSRAECYIGMYKQDREKNEDCLEKAFNDLCVFIDNADEEYFKSDLSKAYNLRGQIQAKTI